MKSGYSTLVIGYHGCDEDVGEAILAGEPMRQTTGKVDWLGAGVYFWEGDKKRALEWAHKLHALGECPRPFVIGAVMDLGNCLDLTQRENIDFLGDAYGQLKALFDAAGRPMPVNKSPKSEDEPDKLLRFLDCAVIEHVHQIAEDQGTPFDSVRGLFVEGEPAYAGATFMKLSHTQIAIRNQECIIGKFRVEPKR